jgi:hypothetical protein
MDDALHGWDELQDWLQRANVLLARMAEAARLTDDVRLQTLCEVVAFELSAWWAFIESHRRDDACSGPN